MVGEANCEDVMYGAALLGPLPEDYQLIWRYNERSQNVYVNFLGLKSGKFYAEDPRLGELSRGWTRKEHLEDGFFSWFVNGETGEDMGSFDPRLTPEALRARGVKLEEFKRI